MLGYQSTSFHDALAMRDLLGPQAQRRIRAWLARQGLIDDLQRIRPPGIPSRFRALTHGLTPWPTSPPSTGRYLERVRRLSGARIGLQRTGASLATGPAARLKLAHARARDAVHDDSTRRNCRPISHRLAST